MGCFNYYLILPHWSFLLKSLLYEIKQLLWLKLDHLGFKAILLNQFDVEQVVHETKQHIQLVLDQLQDLQSLSIKVLLKQSLQKHNWGPQRSAKLVRNCRSVALQTLVSILLFKYLTLQSQLLDMLSHILKVHSYWRSFQVLYFLGPYPSVLIFRDVIFIVDLVDILQLTSLECFEDFSICILHFVFLNVETCHLILYDWLETHFCTVAHICELLSALVV